MTRRATRTRQADADLAEIVAYIAADSPPAAKRLSDKLDAKGDLLAAFPGIGRPDPERAGRRIFLVGSYLIIYRETSHGIEVLRYVHGRRDLRRAI